MKTLNAPYLAFALGIVFMLVTQLGIQPHPQTGQTALSILTLLMLNEFGLLGTLAGGYIGIKHFLQGHKNKLYLAVSIFCLLLSFKFLFFIVVHWPL